MEQLSTTYPQLFPLLIPLVALLFSFFATGACVYVSHKLHAEFPGKSDILLLRKEVAKLDGEMGDLEDRFTRFQKRRGMQDAREEKTRQKATVEEAQAIIASQAAGPAGPAAVDTDKDAFRRSVFGGRR